MDTMERYKIQASIKDVIAILDSVPIRRDLIPEANVVQLTNRMADAHLAIERGLKALIKDIGGTPECIHALNKLYRDLGKCDQRSANYLAKAFGDAVEFFGYNLNVKGFGHFRSLDDYLAKVGTEEAFEEFRYWAIGETRIGESAIANISPPVHRELLRALWCLFLPGVRETVSQRVEREVAEAMFRRRHLYYGSDDEGKEYSVRQYKNWLFKEHHTCCSALEEAVKQGFTIKEGDEFVSQTLREAYNDLRQSKDPAVQYYIGKLSYLPKGSQWQNPEANPRMTWSNKAKTAGLVETPAGTCLGFIEKYADGGWGIEPMEEGLAQVTDIAESAADARHYLVNRLTKQVTVTVEGKPRQMRIVSEHDFFLPRDPRWTSDIENAYEVEFWDDNHGLHPDEQISIELLPEEGRRSGCILEGTVTAVSEQKVSITGMAIIDVKRGI